jgi:hypothetical protein
MLIFRIIIGAGIILTILLTLNQVRAHRAGHLYLSHRQMAIRVCSGVTLTIILTLVLVGNIYGILFTSAPQSLARDRHLLLITIAYACLIAGLSCLLLFLALLDIREVAKSHRQARMDARASLQRKDGRDS